MRFLMVRANERDSQAKIALESNNSNSGRIVRLNVSKTAQMSQTKIVEMSGWDCGCGAIEKG